MPKRSVGSRSGKHAAPRRLSANMEDYLEAIYTLSEKSGVSRVSSIAEAIGVKKPSVSKAIRRLSRQGLVMHTPYGGATVTARGRAVAQAQVRSHRALTRFLQEVLTLPGQLAEHDACLMEHAISHETVERLVQFIDYLNTHGQKTVSGFGTGLRKREIVLPRAPRSARAWTSRV
jgi:DtxR family Mn-dependent transcriptional regulator